MADKIYKVRDPQGNIREIKGPEGATDEEVIAQAQKLFSQPSVRGFRVSESLKFPLLLRHCRASVKVLAM